MKHNSSASFTTAIIISVLFTACAGQNKKIIFRPDTPNTPQEQSGVFDTWEIIKTQNGPASGGGPASKGGPDGDIPEWVRWHVDNQINEIEASDKFSEKYIFIGETGGSNFSALQQWANGFSVEQDLPRLITRRVERRLISSAALYPDDEYGEFFEFFMKDVSNGEFLGAVKEQTFWLKRKYVSSEEDDDTAQPKPNAAEERYEFFVLISVDRETLQKQIQGIMTKIKTKIPATKEQASAIAKIKNTFFEGF